MESVFDVKFRVQLEKIIDKVLLSIAVVVVVNVVVTGGVGLVVVVGVVVGCVVVGGSTVVGLTTGRRKVMTSLIKESKVRKVEWGRKLEEGEFSSSFWG